MHHQLFQSGLHAAWIGKERAQTVSKRMRFALIGPNQIMRLSPCCAVIVVGKIGESYQEIVVNGVKYCSKTM